MGAYILRRVAVSLLLIIGIFIVVFFVLRIAGGDPARLQAGAFASEDVVQEYQEEFGTEKSILDQLGSFLSGVPRGDFGTSFRYQEPVLVLILQYAPYTLLLGGISLLIIIALSALLGVLSAVRRDSWIDRSVIALTVFGQSAPVFWVALMAVLLFSVRLELVPAVSFYGWQSLILPVAALVISELPWQLRVVRAEMSETLLQDYIQTVEAYGIRKWRIYFMYALRNATIPWMSVPGVQAGYLLGGTIVVEVVFNYPGLGRLLVDAVNSGDYPLVQGITIVTATLFILFNLLVDVAYTLVDQRIRLGTES
jgi:ABC-type dipeptide/oligopeptide/nickel transport system permease component